MLCFPTPFPIIRVSFVQQKTKYQTMRGAQLTAVTRIAMGQKGDAYFDTDHALDLLTLAEALNIFP